MVDLLPFASAMVIAIDNSHNGHMARQGTAWRGAAESLDAPPCANLRNREIKISGNESLAQVAQ